MAVISVLLNEVACDAIERAYADTSYKRGDGTRARETGNTTENPVSTRSGLFTTLCFDVFILPSGAQRGHSIRRVVRHLFLG